MFFFLQKEWRDEPEVFKEHVKKLCEESLKHVPPHVVIPHPDTDKNERERAIAMVKGEETVAFSVGDGFEDDFEFDFE